ncbi:MAG: CHAT domain-containing protein, partial [Candidatus Omnitrophica bacterium]|nr:CHAT domain-containing protein [Candidatus Omnitrophota bacterium]
MRNPAGLILEIFKKGDNRLQMSIITADELARTVRHYSTCPYSLPQIKKICQEVTACLNKINVSASANARILLDLKKLGELLWGHLLSRQVKERLRPEEALSLTLVIDEELIYIPWELLNDGRDFLCLKFNLGRIVRSKEQVHIARYRSASSGILRMLIIADPTADLESAYLEGRSIKKQFDRHRSLLKIDFKSSCVDTLYLKKNLRDYDIVHFAGHCEHEADDPKASGWIFTDGRLDAQDILSQGHSTSFPVLIFANACHSADSPKSMLESDYQENTYSLIEAFLFSGVRIYLGSIRKIEDKVSFVFAQEFYTRLINGGA